jgi:beta-N-acetylhexosaminidase
VFLPAIDNVDLPKHIVDHLAGGGTSVLLGESRQEYVDRAMSPKRQSTETREWFVSISDRIRTVAGGRALVAVDQELGGIQRLHDLVTPLPPATDAVEADSQTIEAVARRLASECREFGVNVVLSPIVDVLNGPNPWLERRTISGDPATVGRVAAAFLRGLQQSGRVAATAKHFPGHPCVPLDPAIDERSVVEADIGDLEPGLGAFRKVISAGVRVVMVGPTLVPAMDSDRAASRSAAIVESLRTDYGFGGVVLSDDLDQLGVLRGDTMDEAAVDALNAGIDWLLVAGTSQLPDLVSAIVDAVDDGRVDRSRLNNAAGKVRGLTLDLG